MKKKMVNKLRSRSGETLAETLISLLIAALALVMLAGAISASAKVITTSRQKLSTYYSENEKPGGVVSMSGSATKGSINITTSGTTGVSQSVAIEYFRNDVFSQTPVIAYRTSTSG